MSYQQNQMEEMNTRFHPRHFLEESPNRFQGEGCVLCGNKFTLESHFYYCRKCELLFHKDCAATWMMLMKPTINHPKIHEHTLTFLRRKSTFVCDACGEFDIGQMNMYTCVQCDFFVHKECIFLPRVIKVTRYSHRLSHTFCIRDENLSCGVCHINLEMGHGGYVCVDKVCNYVVHSYCATRSDVWDGKDVEGEPEEENNYEVDLAPSVEEDGKKLRHFSHEHDLMILQAGIDLEASGKLCQACILPIDFGNFLGCNQCEFTIHDICAHLPRKMEHMLHRHPLILQVNTMEIIKEGFFTCSICNQDSCGFMYKCCREDCAFKIDVKCASFAEPFNHPAHPNPLLLKRFGKNELPQICYACNQFSLSETMASDHQGYFVFDFKCVTLPGLIRYKYDIHPLTLYTFTSREIMWCEICEQIIRKSSFFYTCKDCCTVLHVECILGKHPYLKRGHRINVSGLEIQIDSNSGVSRRTCHRCHCLCQDKLVFINRRYNLCFCSIKCIQGGANVDAPLARVYVGNFFETMIERRRNRRNERVNRDNRGARRVSCGPSTSSKPNFEEILPNYKEVLETLRKKIL